MEPNSAIKYKFVNKPSKGINDHSLITAKILTIIAIIQKIVCGKVRYDISSEKETFI